MRLQKHAWKRCNIKTLPHSPHSRRFNTSSEPQYKAGQDKDLSACRSDMISTKHMGYTAMRLFLLYLSLLCWYFFKHTQIELEHSDANTQLLLLASEYWVPLWSVQCWHYYHFIWFYLPLFLQMSESECYYYVSCY